MFHQTRFDVECWLRWWRQLSVVIESASARSRPRMPSGVASWTSVSSVPFVAHLSCRGWDGARRTGDSPQDEWRSTNNGNETLPLECYHRIGINHCAAANGAPVSLIPSTSSALEPNHNSCVKDNIWQRAAAECYFLVQTRPFEMKPRINDCV